MHARAAPPQAARNTLDDRLNQTLTQTHASGLALPLLGRLDGCISRRAASLCISNRTDLVIARRLSRVPASRNWPRRGGALIGASCLMAKNEEAANLLSTPHTVPTWHYARIEPDPPQYPTAQEVVVALLNLSPPQVAGQAFVSNRADGNVDLYFFS